MQPEPFFEKTVYGEIYKAALPFLQTRENDLHTKVSLRFALRLLEEEGGNAAIVVPSVLLHDVGWSRVPEHLQSKAFGPKVTRPDLRDLHERAGAAISRDVLSVVGYPSREAETIVTIVSRHDSRPDGESLEERIVKDADKLWRYSREGVRSLVQRFGMEPLENLARIENALDKWFLTGSGWRLAREELGKRTQELQGAWSPSEVAA